MIAIYCAGKDRFHPITSEKSYGFDPSPQATDTIVVALEVDEAHQDRSKKHQVQERIEK